MRYCLNMLESQKKEKKINHLALITAENKICFMFCCLKKFPLLASGCCTNVLIPSVRCCHTHQVHLTQVELGTAEGLPALPPQGTELHRHLCCLHRREHFLQDREHLWRNVTRLGIHFIEPLTCHYTVLMNPIQPGFTTLLKVPHLTDFQSFIFSSQTESIIQKTLNDLQKTA